MDPSGHDRTFSSQACCVLVVFAAFSLQTQVSRAAEKEPEQRSPTLHLHVYHNMRGE